MIRGEILLIDFDGVLSEGECWTPEECLNAEPIQKNIDMVNKLSQGNFIVIWTARTDNLLPASIKWLREHSVRFDAISNKKPGASYYVDDKCTTLEKLLARKGRRGQDVKR